MELILFYINWKRLDHENTEPPDALLKCQLYGGIGDFTGGTQVAATFPVLVESIV